MWTELGGETGKEKKVVPWPKRESRLRVKEQLESAGLPDSGPTNYAFGTQSSPIRFSFYVLNKLTSLLRLPSIVRRLPLYLPPYVKILPTATQREWLGQPR
jgi:hypothetical protein